MMTYDDMGTGFLEDGPDACPPEIKSTDELFGAGTDETTVDRRSSVVDILLQGPAQTCTAFAWVQIARTLQKMQGIENPKLASARDIYFNSLRDKTRDMGAAIGEMFVAVLANGYCDDDVWPYDPKGVLVPPPPRVRSQTYDQVGKIQYYRTEEWGTAKRQGQIEKALQLGWLGMGGIPIEATFKRYRGGVWNYPGAADASDAKSWHAVGFVGYTPEGLICPNSYGPDWGDNGYFILGWETVRNPYLGRNFYIVRLVPPTTTGA